MVYYVRYLSDIVLKIRIRYFIKYSSLVTLLITMNLSNRSSHFFFNLYFAGVPTLQQPWKSHVLASSTGVKPLQKNFLEQRLRYVSPTE